MKKYLFLILATCMIGACTATDVPPPADSSKAPQSEVTEKRRDASWETIGIKHWKDGKLRFGEKAWTDLIVKTAYQDLEIYNKAKDITELCPKWKSLSDALKVKAILEFWVALGGFESQYKVDSSSVDVGTASNRNSFSDGLYQLSGTDSAAKKYSCDYQCLHDPLKNITVAMEQMRRQIAGKDSKYQGCGSIFLDNSSPCRYWAPTLKGNVHSRIEDYQEMDKNKKRYGPFLPGIKSKVLKYAPECK